LSLLPDFDAVVSDVDPADSPEVLSRFIAEAVKDALSAAKPEERVTLANRLLTQLQPDNQVTPGPRQLLSLNRPDTLRQRQLRRPTTKLSESALLTNGKDDPNLAAELRTEIESANTVDLLCAFVRWTGLRLLEPALEQLNERGVKFRVITTTYMGATERRAIDELVRRYGAEVKISYETQATRLHAKAWLFRRQTGFDTAYVGSSNLSQAALLDGLEWNVRLSSVATPALLKSLRSPSTATGSKRPFRLMNPIATVTSWMPRWNGTEGSVLPLRTLSPVWKSSPSSTRRRCSKTWKLRGRKALTVISLWQQQGLGRQ
jgi:HKD family nuclease